MVYDVMYYFLIFIICSFAGWLIEVIGMFFISKKFMNRGFLIGPYCPIYGFSALIMIWTLQKHMDDPFVLFIVIAFVASIMEYFTSLLMEKLFKARWWDYYHMKFNINGRVCLEFASLFGLLGLTFMYWIFPFLSNILLKTNEIILISISSFIMLLFIVDTIISFNVIRKLEVTADALRKDYTEEITNKVKEIITTKSRLAKRLLRAFPNFKVINIKIKLKK